MARVRPSAAELLTETKPGGGMRVLAVGTSIGAPLGILMWLVLQDPGAMNWIITRTLWVLGQH